MLLVESIGSRAKLMPFRVSLGPETKTIDHFPHGHIYSAYEHLQMSTRATELVYTQDIFLTFLCLVVSLQNAVHHSHLIRIPN